MSCSFLASLFFLESFRRFRNSWNYWQIWAPMFFDFLCFTMVKTQVFQLTPMEQDEKRSRNLFYNFVDSSYWVLAWTKTRRRHSVGQESDILNSFKIRFSWGNRLFKFETGQFVAGWRTETQLHLCIIFLVNLKFFCDMPFDKKYSRFFWV